ncbi:MAG: DUF4011 domain-containing protein [Acidobacteria bacterium]|nr:MAG: DUF4011 domain-containing protein [Acidobacteriota bacterium]
MVVESPMNEPGQVGEAPSAQDFATLGAKLDRDRRDLLNLDLRNALLNYKFPRTRSVRIVDELSHEVFRILVSEERTMSFLAVPEDQEDAVLAAADETLVEDLDWAKLLKTEEAAADVPGDAASRHSDRYLQTDLSKVRLDRRIHAISKIARTLVEEQGVNVLYLALGFLRWFESPSSQKALMAPLLLVPVRVDRYQRGGFRILYSGEDVVINTPLSEKFQQDFRLVLPGLEDEVDPLRYFEQVERAITGQDKWRVEKDRIALGFFSYLKYLMFEDLDPANWPEGENPLENELLRALYGEASLAIDTSLAGTVSGTGDDLTLDDLCQVMDADGSQSRAMLEARRGGHLVIQGPPGTGKSQTITNLLADAITQRKKVLFVAEKAAALEVVKRRLDQVGLADAVLELHSHKVKKRDVAEELGRCLKLGKPVESEADVTSAVRHRTAQQLDAYAEALREPINQSTLTPTAALGRLLKHGYPDPEMPLLGNRHEFARWTSHEAVERLRQVEELDHRLQDAGALAGNPLAESQRTGALLPPEELQLREQSAKAADSLQRSQVACSDLAEFIGAPKPENLQGGERLISFTEHLVARPDLDGIVVSDPRWAHEQKRMVLLLEALEQRQRGRERHGSTVDEAAWSAPVDEALGAYRVYGSKWWRMLSGRFRSARQTVAALSGSGLPRRVQDQQELLEAIRSDQESGKKLRQHAELGEILLRKRWQVELTDSGWARAACEWVFQLHQKTGEATFPPEALKIATGSWSQERLQELLARAREASDSARGALEELLSALGLGVEARSASYDEWLRRLDRWASDLVALRLTVWLREREDEWRSKGLGEVFDLAISWAQAPGRLAGLLEYSRMLALLESAAQARPELRDFERAAHEKTRFDFGHADRKMFDHNKVRAAAAHWEGVPNPTGAVGEVALLLREAAKKRRHMPVRKLLLEAGRAIQQVKPIFMMSPLSVATFLPRGQAQFDLVVFDEASQVKPVEAVGSLLRGRQAIVVGDKKQLPPTAFFQRVTSGDETDEAEDEGVADDESILSTFDSRGAPSEMLEGHYRSRHHSLIAVSNAEFYDNRLLTFPSVGDPESWEGVHRRLLGDAVYDRGKSSTNKQEARAVAAEVIRHLEAIEKAALPNYTLGVVAFSMAQQKVLDEYIDFELRQRPQLGDLLHQWRERGEPLFVKNLENVQGDERDRIIISIGYGKASDGDLFLNFGPLTKEGGERRLNVLISRARIRCDVFSNFRAADLDLKRTPSRGIEALKHYLHFAETGQLDETRDSGSLPDSVFEQEVFQALRSRNLLVERQVGFGPYRIDLALKDPEQPGRFALGIECDGATYHSTAWARDRDRLRQEVLEKKGWRIHRVWSTDWWRNPQREVDLVVRAYELALEARTIPGSAPRAAASKKDEQAEREPPLAEVLSRPAAASLAPTETRKEPERLAPVIRRQEVQPDEVAEGPLTRPYEKAPLPAISGSITNSRWDDLMRAAKVVLEVESPVSMEDFVIRMREAAGVGRAGRLIQNHLGKLVAEMQRQGILERRGGFLWKPGQTEVEVRDRSSFLQQEKKIDRVSPEEIRAALRGVLQRGHRVGRDELLTSACRDLGFLRMSKEIGAALGAVLETDQSIAEVSPGVFALASEGPN